MFATLFSSFLAFAGGGSADSLGYEAAVYALGAIDCPKIYYAGAYDAIRMGGQMFDPHTSSEVQPKSEQWNAPIGLRTISCSVGGKPGSESMYTKTKLASDPDSKADLCVVTPWENTLMQCAEHDESTFSQFKVEAVTGDCAVASMVRLSLETGSHAIKECSAEGDCETMVTLMRLTRAASNPSKTVCP